MSSKKFWILPVYLRSELKKPMGTLFMGSPLKIWREIKSYVVLANPIEKIVTVGDIVTVNCLTYTDIVPDVMIVDGRTLRKQYHIDPQIILKKKKVKYLLLEVKNPAGTITQETINALKKIYTMSSKVILYVHGEEDLVTIPAVIYAPYSSFVIYGQPSKGVVLIEVTKTIKNKFEDIFKKMEEVSHGD
ncbi:MAG: GTP-dependent dephospho-CoA kinase family protein [Candidatus Asgardarchaeia archaeon]